MKNRIKRDKKLLVGLGFLFLVIGIVALAGGVFMVLAGVEDIAVKTSLTIGIIQIVIGSIIALGSLIGVGYSVFIFIMAGAVVATDGSIAQDNLAKVGTINMIKCPNCGSEVGEKDAKCGNCGSDLAKTKKCAKCGAEVDAKNKKCTSCGEDL